jgi:hypothetical protein
VRKRHPRGEEQSSVLKEWQFLAEDGVLAAEQAPIIGN